MKKPQPLAVAVYNNSPPLLPPPPLLQVDNIGDVTITNDGATILKQLEVEHPAAKVLVDLAELQDTEVGDGTTSVVIIAAELLRASTHARGCCCFWVQAGCCGCGCGGERGRGRTPAAAAAAEGCG